MSPVILPGSMVNGQMATLGVMGGGQLGRMFVHAAQAMGYFTAVLDPDAASPAGLVSHHHIQTDYLDEQGLAIPWQGAVGFTPTASAAVTANQAKVRPPSAATDCCPCRPATALMKSGCST